MSEHTKGELEQQHQMVCNKEFGLGIAVCRIVSGGRGTITNPINNHDIDEDEAVANAKELCRRWNAFEKQQPPSEIINLLEKARKLTAHTCIGKIDGRVDESKCLACILNQALERLDRAEAEIKRFQACCENEKEVVATREAKLKKAEADKADLLTALKKISDIEDERYTHGGFNLEVNNISKAAIAKAKKG